MKYKLLSWHGQDCDVTLGKNYNCKFEGNAHFGNTFKDDNDCNRAALHGRWTKVEPLCKEVKGVQPSNTWLDKAAPDSDETVVALIQNSGENGNYYRCTVLSKTTLDNRGDYDAEANDIIETLEMNFAEANAFKAVWRKAAARLGNGKANNNPLYDAQKVKWSGERLVAQES